jgi:hypothetical protein
MGSQRNCVRWLCNAVLATLVTISIVLLSNIANRPTHCDDLPERGCSDFPLYDSGYRLTPRKPKVVDSEYFQLRDATYTEALQLSNGDNLEWLSYTANETTESWIPTAGFVTAIRQVAFESDHRINELQSSEFQTNTFVIVFVMIVIVAVSRPPISLLLFPIAIIALTAGIMFSVGYRLPHGFQSTPPFISCHTVNDGLQQPCVPRDTFNHVSFVAIATINFEYAQGMSDFGYNEFVIYSTFSLVLLCVYFIFLLVPTCCSCRNCQDAECFIFCNHESWDKKCLACFKHKTTANQGESHTRDHAQDPVDAVELEGLVEFSESDSSTPGTEESVAEKPPSAPEVGECG